MSCIVKGCVMSEEIGVMELGRWGIRELCWGLVAGGQLRVVLRVGWCWGEKAKSVAQVWIREINM